MQSNGLNRTSTGIDEVTPSKTAGGTASAWRSSHDDDTHTSSDKCTIMANHDPRTRVERIQV
jgi:hypothetical protein